MRQVLVTGAGGFIGKHTVLRFVRQGCFVHALARSSVPPVLREMEAEGKITLSLCDLRDDAALAAIFAGFPRLDALVHCAAIASDVGRDRDFRAVNYEAVRRLALLARANGTGRFVFVSTTDVYGMRDFSGEAEDELERDMSARNPYPRYKILAEQWLEDNLAPDAYCCIRPAAVWGDDDPTLTRRIREFLRASPFIAHFGPWKGKNRWPLAHVETVALANYLGAFHPDAKGRAINVLDPERTSMDEFYQRTTERYLPGKRHARICLPLWAGILVGGVGTALANLLDRTQPLWDPTLYAMYSVSRNLDFSGERFEALRRTAYLAEPEEE